MSQNTKVPNSVGQLVWCPSDPSLGVGVVTQVSSGQLTVRFWRLQEDRIYTTRGADHAIIRYEIAVGERVRDAQGRDTRVARLVSGVGAALSTYELDDGIQAVESELVPNVRDIGAKERLATLNLIHPEVVRARVLGMDLAAVGARPGNAAVLGGRVQWLPHQIDVATRALSQDPVRMLLADEVGLGKTVEAALIYAGLRQEGRAARVLILTPESLCIQWLGEIYRKVHELFVLLDEQRLEDTATDFPDLNPFEAHQHIVTAIDRVVADPMLVEQALNTTWDLVIVDEAHHLRWRPKDGGNTAYRLVEGLAARSRHMLLLTATPMALDPTEYHALLRLLDPIRFDDPSMFDAVGRRVSTIRDLSLQLTTAVDEKKSIGKKLQAAVQEFLSDDAHDVAAFTALSELTPASPKRRGALEAVMEALRYRHGLADYVVRNRRGPVGGLPERKAMVFGLEPTEKQAELIEVGEAVMFELAQTIDDPKIKHRVIGELLRSLWATPLALIDVLKPYSTELVRELWPHIQEVVQAPLDKNGLPTGDARLRWLVKHIHAMPPQEKLLVFVESAVAVRALKDALEPVLGGNLAMFHRDLSPRDQDRQVSWFRSPSGPQVMLSTEAGGEGRNFQFCHQVVLYDLPWRPATVEQRIGRVDRVGQAHDVHVLVPYFKSGYEAAILKVMQEAIGVLDRTVGGIDHALEHVSDQVAALVLENQPADQWKKLYVDVKGLVGEARERIAAGVDPILDFASFSAERAQEILDVVPKDLETRLETFVQRYAGHSKLELHGKGPHLLAVEGAVGAAGREDSETGYVATFSRTHALDHEDVEFLSFGHPLVNQAFEWAHEAHDASAALAICRGFATDSAVFVWRYGLDLPDDVGAAAAYFETQALTFAVDEAGKHRPELESLLKSNERPLDRMDPSPLRGALPRWRSLVEQNHTVAERLAQNAVKESVAGAEKRLGEAMQRRRRDLERSFRRALESCPPESAQRQALEERNVEQMHEIERAHERMLTAIRHARPRLVAAMAVRLLRTKQVSA